MIIKKLHTLFLKGLNISTDTRKTNTNDLFFALKGERFNANSFAENALKKGAKYAIIDEVEYKTSNQMILVDNVLETLQDLARFHRDYLKIPIIALTGSNGKTTTKELINTVLSKRFKTKATIGNLNNHIGVPLTILSMTKETEIGIVEMGANHLNEIAFLCSIAKPDFGYITNFGKAHLEGFGSIQGVIKGKSELYKHIIKNNKVLFINNEDQLQIKQSKKANVYTFGQQDSDVIINNKNKQPYVEVFYNNINITSQLIGSYNFNNIAAAITIGNYFKVPDNKIKLAIEGYVPKNNRSQIIIKETNKIILDAYNANPSSMKAALTNFHELKHVNKIAILGDMFELGEESKLEHQNIVNYATSLNINLLILVGKNFNQTNTRNDNVLYYKTFNELKNNIKAFTNSTVLIKGSRGMALERILEFVSSS